MNIEVLPFSYRSGYFVDRIELKLIKFQNSRILLQDDIFENRLLLEMITGHGTGRRFEKAAEHGLTGVRT
jgi:hypothetical protein